MRPDPVSDLETREGAEDEQIISTVERADLHAALKCLDKRERELIQLRYDEDLTQQAIARRLGLPDGTVKVRLHRLRHKLRRVLTELRQSPGGSASLGGAAHRIGSRPRPDVGDEHREEQVG